MDLVFKILVVVAVLAGLAVLAYAIKHKRSAKVTLSTEGISIDAPVESAAAVVTLAPVQPEPVSDLPTEREEWKKIAQSDHDRLFGVEEEIRSTASLIAAGPNGTITSLHGAGGLGKTAIAYEAVLAARSEYTSVAWASARLIVEDENRPSASRLGYKEVLARLCEQLKFQVLSPSMAPETFVHGVRALSRRQKLLLVVDNLESASDLGEIVRLLTGERIVEIAHVVLTTRVQVDARSLPSRVRVYERTLSGLSIEDSCAFIRHLGQASPAIAAADDDRLTPIPRVVDGNPYLIKITTRQLCQRAQPLDRLLAEIRTLDQAKERSTTSLAQEIRDFMFAAALEQLDTAVGPPARGALLAAFCAEPPGSRLRYENLLEDSGLTDTKFVDTLDAAVGLSLVHKHDLNEQFSIHSLLHAYSSGHGAQS